MNNRVGAIGIVLAIIIGAGLGYLDGTSVSVRSTDIRTTTTTAPGTTLTSTAIYTTTSATTTTVVTTIPGPNAGQLGKWNQTAAYPLFAQGLSCATNQGYVYCVGGYNGTDPFNGKGDLNRTFYARLASTGVSAWIRTDDYPIGIQEESCVATMDYIYCVGGYVSSPTNAITALVYFAPLSPSGVGPWKQTTSYPYAAAPHCFVYSGYLYCASARAGSGSAGDLYYTQLSSSGVGTWIQSTGLPYYTAGCSASGGYAYCFGGGRCPSPGPCFSPSYFAPLSPNGVGAWSSTSELASAVWANYAMSGSFEYYFAGPVYFASLSSSGIGAWGTTNPYPAGYAASCFANMSYLYCIGGTDHQTGLYVNSVYIALISP